MTYSETVQYLYDCVPMFQQVGNAGYKEGLENTLALDKRLEHPHRNFKTIHIAGTNGKGSCSHTIASILQHAGYRLGLYTSPHLLDFRERIRINGEPVTEQYVVNFVNEYRSFFEPLHPSFFEVTTAMAFKYFSDMKVDIAVIEVGLGGRLDCTNIISPILSIITNISFDHTQYLGDTLAKIASEKAGIIKPHTPVVIGETTPETKPVFVRKAAQEESTICFAEDTPEIISSGYNPVRFGRIYQTRNYNELVGELAGICQDKNANTILHALPFLANCGIKFTEQDIRNGFADVCETTGLMGRWQKLGDTPLVVCDTGHNEGGFNYISRQLNAEQQKRTSLGTLRIVFGMVSDKDISAVLRMLPQEAVYYFTKASIKRALSENELQAKAQGFRLCGNSYPTVSEAYETALSEASPNDFVFVGGSSYVVAELLSHIYKKEKP